MKRIKNKEHNVREMPLLTIDDINPEILNDHRSTQELIFDFMNECKNKKTGLNPKYLMSDYAYIGELLGNITDVEIKTDGQVTAISYKSNGIKKSLMCNDTNQKNIIQAVILCLYKYGSEDIRNYALGLLGKKGTLFPTDN